MSEKEKTTLRMQQRNALNSQLARSFADTVDSAGEVGVSLMAFICAALLIVYAAARQAMSSNRAKVGLPTTSAKRYD